MCAFTRADDACVEYGEVFLAGGERGDGEGAIGLGAAAHPPLRRRTRTLSSWTQREKCIYHHHHTHWFTMLVPKGKQTRHNYVTLSLTLRFCRYKIYLGGQI